MQPLVTVILPTYNSGGTLEEALASLRAQTYRNIDIIIVADEPTPRELDIIRYHSDHHLRTFLIQHPKRAGLVASLNEGFAMAPGKYIARMDADDISYPDRIRQQVAFMEGNPDVGVCGSAVIHEWHGVSEKSLCPTNNASIIATMIMLGCAIIHPAAMIRAEFIRTIPGPYRDKYLFAEDYDLWIRCIGKTRMHNLETVLLRYRADGTNVCAANFTEQAKQLVELRAMAAAAVDLPPQGTMTMEEYLHTLSIVNSRNRKLPVDSFNRILAETWYNSCLLKARNGLVAWHVFWDSPLSQYIPLSIGRKIKFLGACLIRLKFGSNKDKDEMRVCCPVCGKPYCREAL